MPGVNQSPAAESRACRTRAFESSTATAVQGVCGKASGGTFTSSPTADLCAAGVPSAVAGAGPWSWSCLGAGGGAEARCGASLAGEPGGGGASGGGAAGSSRSGGCATGGGAVSLVALVVMALRRRRPAFTGRA